MRTNCPHCGRRVRFRVGGWTVICWTCRRKYNLPHRGKEYGRAILEIAEIAVGAVLAVVLWFVVVGP